MTTEPTSHTFGARCDYTAECHNFDLRDGKGRMIGAVVERCCQFVVARVEPVSWRSLADDFEIGAIVLEINVCAARNGKKFGASFHNFTAGDVADPETETKAAEHIERRLRTMRKRYEKQIAKGKV